MAKISVRLNGELLKKLQQWKSYGFSLSDTVRQGLALLPPSPIELPTFTSSLAIKPLSKDQIQLQPRGERDALRALQEW